MDLTDILMQMGAVTGISVYQDICTDENAESYITCVYQDERPALCGDNRVIADQCDIYVNLYTQPDFDYFKVKKEIRDYLERNEFVVSSISTGIEDDISGSKIRRTTFDCRYAGFRE